MGIQVKATKRGEPLYERALDFARQRYAEEHGARIRSLAPYLVVAERNGAIAACVGVTAAGAATSVDLGCTAFGGIAPGGKPPALRSAAGAAASVDLGCNAFGGDIESKALASVSGRLLCESYLPSPVESLVSSEAGRLIPRHRIAEIGSLAASDGAALAAVVFTGTSHLEHLGFEFALITATQRVRRLMKALGIQSKALGPATRESLPEAEREPWGRYYDADPIVLLCSLDQPAFRLGAERMRAASAA